MAAPRAEVAPAAASASSEPAAAVAEAEPEPQVAPVEAEPGLLELERLRQLWPAVVDEVCKQNGMVGAFLTDARPAAVDRERLTVRFGPGAGFGKKKVESNRAIVQVAVKAVTGALVTINCEMAEAADEGAGVPVAAAPVLNEDELVERLKGEFGAREVFDDSEES
jgi:hypothetical protein